MITKYEFEYGFGEAFVTFLVNKELFTADHAKSTLEFYTWYYDKEEDPVDAVLKKYAIKSISIASLNGYNELGVIGEFEDLEGYCKIDGSAGITLTSVTGYEFDESDLRLSITDTKK